MSALLRPTHIRRRPTGVWLRLWYHDPAWALVWLRLWPGLDMGLAQTLVWLGHWSGLHPSRNATATHSRVLVINAKKMLSQWNFWSCYVNTCQLCDVNVEASFTLHRQNLCLVFTQCSVNVPSTHVTSFLLSNNFPFDVQMLAKCQWLSLSGLYQIDMTEYM